MNKIIPILFFYLNRKSWSIFTKQTFNLEISSQPSTSYKLRLFCVTDNENKLLTQSPEWSNMSSLSLPTYCADGPKCIWFFKWEDFKCCLYVTDNALVKLGFCITTRVNLLCSVNKCPLISCNNRISLSKATIQSPPFSLVFGKLFLQYNAFL